MSMNRTFAGSRLSVVRQRRSLTKKTLAERVGVSGAAMTEFENGKRSPSTDTARRLAFALEVPVEFFYGDEIESVHVGVASFRALRSMSAKVRDRVFSTGTWAASVISPYLESKFILPEQHLPVFVGDQADPSITAAEVRSEWHLAGGAVDNVIHLLESKGVQVYWYDDPSGTTDAVSFWWDERPYIIVSADRPGERQRLSVAHELGHLMLHRDLTIDHADVEKEAFEFASHFLLPSEQFRRAFAEAISSGLFTALFKIKRDWGISVAAALRRCRDLALISDWQYEHACRELSIQGWRKAEPKPVPEEASLLHEKIFYSWAGKGISPAHVADELGISLLDLLELMPTGRRYCEQAHQVTEEREHLRLLR